MNTIKSGMVNLKHCLMLLVVALGMGIPQRANAGPLQLSSGCYYTIGSTNYVKVTFDNASYIYILNNLNGPGSTRTVTIEVYNVDPVVNTMATPVVTTTGLPYGPSVVASVGTMSPTYYVKAIVTYTSANGITDIFESFNTVNAPCNFRQPDPYGVKEGCYSIQGGQGLLKLTFDPAVLLYGAVNNYNPTSNLPILKLYDPVSGILIGTFFSNTVNGLTSTVIYDISSAGLDGKCYDFLAMYNIPSGDVLTYQLPDLGPICPCDKPIEVGCNAKFSTETTDAGGGSFFLDIRAAFGTITSTETWTVKQGSTLIYSGAPMILMLPNGTYTVCRTVTGDNGSTCEWCVDVCYSGEVVNPPIQSDRCAEAAKFSTNYIDNGNGTFILDIASLNPANITSESMTISQGGAVIYSGLMVNHILPNGTYTVCHYVEVGDNVSCEWCADVCFTGNASNSPLKPARADENTKPKKLTSSQATAIKTGSELQINFVADEQGKVDYAVYNSMGQVIISAKSVFVQKGNNKLTTSGSALSTGIYYLKVSGSNMSAASKFFVE